MNINASFLALALWALALSSCSAVKITNARVCAEIPFLDGPEGSCVWTVSQKAEWVNAVEWQKQRALMIMIDAKSWTEIKKDWLEACRFADDSCNVKVDSIDRVIRSLDDMVKRVIPVAK
jgi:hypothetical protein